MSENRISDVGKSSDLPISEIRISDIGKSFWFTNIGKSFWITDMGRNSLSWKSGYVCPFCHTEDNLNIIILISFSESTFWPYLAWPTFATSGFPT